MLDVDKLKGSINSNLNLQDIGLDNFIIPMQSMLSQLEHDSSIVTTYEALDILSFLSYFKNYFTSQNQWENLVYSYITNIREGIYGHNFHPFSSFSGICYVAYTLTNLSTNVPQLNRFSDSVNKLLLTNLQAYLMSKRKKHKKNDMNDFELIYGLSGPLRYILDIGQTKQSCITIMQLVDALVVRSHKKILCGGTIPGWHYYPSSYEKASLPFDSTNGCINYGVSHGMGGPLIALSLAYKHGLHSSDLREAIEGIVTEYLDATYYVDNIIYWPSQISAEQYLAKSGLQLQATRMSWCYGSVGILRALYIHSVALSNKEIEKFCVHEMIKIAQMNITDYQLSLPIICHGLAGVAAIMNEMYNDTHLPEFRSKALSLIQHIINCSPLQNARQNPVKPSEVLDKYDFLNGYTGIIQTVFSVLTNKPNGNEQRLFIK